MEVLDRRYEAKIKKDGGAVMAKKKRKLGCQSTSQPPADAPSWAVIAESTFVCVCVCVCVCVGGWVGGWYALCVCGEVRQHSWPSPELLGTRTALLSHPGGACLMVHMYAFF